MHKSFGELLADPGIPKKYEDCSLDNFEGAARIVRFCRDHVKELTAGGHDSVFLTGACGSGKTHLAVGILREAKREGYVAGALFVTIPEFVTDLRDAISSNESEKQVFNRLDGKEMVILDDLGAGKISEYTAQSLFLLVDRCYRD